MEYRRNNSTVEARQLTICDLEDVKNWLSTSCIDWSMGYTYLSLHTHQNSYKVFLGDYIVIDGNSVLVYSEEDFDNAYEKLSEVEK